MALSPNSAASKLILWTGANSDLTGVIVSVDGGVNGFARGGGQFLSIASCKGVIDALVLTGIVKRATLGMTVRQVIPNDTARE